MDGWMRVWGCSNPRARRLQRLVIVGGAVSIAPKLARRQTEAMDIEAVLERKKTMRHIFTAGVVVALLAACTPTEQGAGLGAATGAVVGGAATGNVRGAAVGAAIGGVSGALIGSVAGQPGQCYYRDRYGRRYVDRC